MSNNKTSPTTNPSITLATHGVPSDVTSHVIGAAVNVTENITDPIAARNNINLTANTTEQTKMDTTESMTASNPPRRHFTRQRRQLTANERQRCARDASLHLIKLQQRLPANTRIGLYYDGFGELPTQPLLDWCKRLGYLPYLPVVGSLGNKDKRLRFVPIYHQQLLNIPTRMHSLGMKQNHHRRLLWAAELDVIICPLTAVDKSGNRMGMGGGFYDTTLAKSHQSGAKKPLKIGWCYDFQRVESLVQQPWDVPLDAVITPSGIQWF